MACEWNLGPWREDANPRRVIPVLGRQHKGRFGQVELGGNRLHLLRCQAFRIQDNGEGIAAEFPVCEDVDGYKLQLPHNRLLP